MSDEQTKQPVTISREELYAQVWTTPMNRLGAQYGISGNGLAKICGRLDIPYPPRGYWARNACRQEGVADTTAGEPPGHAGASYDHAQPAGATTAADATRTGGGARRRPSADRGATRSRQASSPAQDRRWLDRGTPALA